MESSRPSTEMMLLSIKLLFCDIDKHFTKRKVHFYFNPIYFFIRLLKVERLFMNE